MKGECQLKLSGLALFGRQGPCRFRNAGISFRLPLAMTAPSQGQSRTRLRFDLDLMNGQSYRPRRNCADCPLIENTALQAVLKLNSTGAARDQ